MTSSCIFLLIDRRRLRLLYEDHVLHSSVVFKGEQRKLKEELSIEHFENVQLKERVEKLETLMSGYRSLLTEVHSVLTGTMKKDYKTIVRELREVQIRLVEFAKQDDSQVDVPLSERKKADFIQRIMATYPDVTEASAKLAYMIAINTPVSTICQILGINAKSVQMARFRMRKKMGLKETESLEDTLQQYFE